MKLLYDDQQDRIVQFLKGLNTPDADAIIKIVERKNSKRTKKDLTNPV